MQETKNIYCGGLSSNTDDKNSILLDVQGENKNIELKIESISKATFGNIDDRSMDLLEIAAYIYCADSKTRRGSAKLTDHGIGWQRDFNFHIPVRDIDFWNQDEVLIILINLLSFMSGEKFNFHFYKANNPVVQKALYFNFVDDFLKPDNVILYSGGLDSFAGVLEQLNCSNQNLALVSHHSANQSKSGQEGLLNQLKSKGYGHQLNHIPVRVVNSGEKVKEYTQRTRSFLFASLAILIARLYDKKDFYFYENGIISFNVPLASDIQGSRATRTTHPRVIAGFKALFDLVFETNEITIHHPYLWLTKTEVAGKLIQYDAKDLVEHTRSCTRIRNVTNNKHCGVCSQCIDRRFAVLASGMEDYEPSSLYQIDLLTGHRKNKEINLAIHFAKFALEIRNMSKNEFLDKYPMIYDSVRYLNLGSSNDSIDKIYTLFQRHSDSVLNVMNKAIREQYDKATLSPNSLLRLYFTESSDRISYTDIDGERMYLEAINSINHQLIYFWEGDEVIKLSGGIVIDGANYEIFNFLLKDYKEGQYKTSFDISDALEIEEPTVRKRINRFRKEIDKEIAVGLGFLGQIIENKTNQGYRINPNLIRVEYASEFLEIDRMSQK